MEDKQWLLIINWARLGKTDEFRFFTLRELREAVSFLKHIQERQGHEWVQAGNGWEAGGFDPEDGANVLFAHWKHITWT